MELTSLLGMVVGIGAIIMAMIFKGIAFTVFLNPAAFTVIFAGTVASILNSYPGKDLASIGKLFAIIFTQSKNVGNEQKIIETIMNLAGKARKDGLLALEADASAMDDPFMSKGFKMIIDGAEPEYVLEVLTAEVEAMEERHSNNAGIFSSAGTYAPTLGVLGAVFGLIAAMGHIDEIEMMSEAVAAAFIATILGIFTGYVMWNPFATKLRSKSKREVFEKTLVIEGILSIQKGEPPVRIKEKLVALLPSSEHAKYEETGGGGPRE